MTITPLRNAEGLITHFCSEQRDVTYEVEAERKITHLLDELTQQRETARMLLALSESLGRRSDIPEIANTIAEAVPRICGSDYSVIGLWDLPGDRLIIAGQSGWPDTIAEAVQEFQASREHWPELAEVLSSGEPVLVDERGPDWAVRLLERFSIRGFAAMPFYAGTTLVGAVAAHWAAQPPEQLDPVLHERMSGLAGLASVAFDNARLLQQAQWNAAHDPLTKLPNRGYLEDALETAIHTARANGTHLAVLYCDVDNFKRTNDDFGHRVGDVVLVEVGRRLTGAVRATDIVARTGGDEFVIILPAITGRQEAEAVAGRIRMAFTVPVEVDDQALTIQVSTGIAVIHPEQIDVAPAAADQLVRDADADMYRAKATDTDAFRARNQPDEDLVSDLRRAIRSGELETVFQPQIDLQTGRAVAVEALARWHHPAKGPLRPDMFIPLAEHAGLIDELGLEVLEQACAWARRARTAVGAFGIAVNVSPLQLHDPSFADRVTAALERHDLPPSSLTIEVTESAVVRNSPDAAALNELRTAGVRIAMDDFGTGFSSLSRLHELPVTDLKIDRSFVQDGPRGAVLVGAIVQMAHALGIRAIAEGIETTSDLEMVREHGCDLAQGYFLAEPKPGDEILAIPNTST